MRYDAVFYVEKLLNFYNVNTLAELAGLLKTRQTSISSWKSRNSIKAIKKKCRELGIYNEIFDEINNSQAVTENSMKEKTDTTLQFSDEITAVLHTASTVINESNKDTFVKMIKDWIIKNI